MSLEERAYAKSPIVFQILLFNIKAIELYMERYGRKFCKLLEEFETNQWLSESELSEYQKEKLRLLIKHA